jgi:hypothetical protein
MFLNPHNSSFELEPSHYQELHEEKHGEESQELSQLLDDVHRYMENVQYSHTFYGLEWIIW